MAIPNSRKFGKYSLYYVCPYVQLNDLLLCENKKTVIETVERKDKLWLELVKERI